MHLTTLPSGRIVARKSIDIEPSLMELIERIAADKLAVFARKYNETAQHIAQEQRVGLALPIAKKLWDECYEV